MGCGTGSPSVGGSSLRKRIQKAIFTKICDPGDTTPGSIASWEGPVVNRGRCWSRSFLSFAVNPAHCFLEMQKWTKALILQIRLLGRRWALRNCFLTGQERAREGRGLEKMVGRGGAWGSPALSRTPTGSALKESASALVARGSLSSPFPAESGRLALCRNTAQFELTLTWGCLEKRKQCPLRESGWAGSTPALTGLFPLWVSAFTLIQWRDWDKSVCTNQRLVRAQGLPESSLLLSFSVLVLSNSLWPPWTAEQPGFPVLHYLPEWRLPSRGL